MRICPITYEPHEGPSEYSLKGLKLLSPRLKNLQPLSLTAAELLRASEAAASKLSIQGVQPKISAVLDVKGEVLKIVERKGRFILKPQIERWKHVPENEDLTMRLAAAVGIEVPLHGLIRAADGGFVYFIKRFDRTGRGARIHVEDFAQLSGENRDTKYQSSMERVAEIIKEFCSFPLLEHQRLFERTLFSFLTGNEDMHLKNFSLMTRDGKRELTPAYDLLNSTMVLANPKEEFALPLNGKKKNLTKKDLLTSFAAERLGLNENVRGDVLRRFRDARASWDRLIDRSFLTADEQARYRDILNGRWARVFGH